MFRNESLWIMIKICGIWIYHGSYMNKFSLLSVNVANVLFKPMKSTTFCWIWSLAWVCVEKGSYISDINPLTHWGRVTHICVDNLTIIVSDNGLSPGRRQAIIWTNAGLLLIGPLGTNFSEISIKILTFSFTKMRLKVSSVKWRPFCLGLNVLSASPMYIWEPNLLCLLMDRHQTVLDNHQTQCWLQCYTGFYECS